MVTSFFNSLLSNLGVVLVRLRFTPSDVDVHSSLNDPPTLINSRINQYASSYACHSFIPLCYH